MSNLEEEIKNIHDEMLQDGTIHDIIKENLKKGYENAIEKAFSWGELSDTIRKRLTEVLTPRIEKTDLSEYVVKLDAVLSQIIRETSLPGYKQILDNFKTITCGKVPDTVTLEDIAAQYEKFVAETLDCTDRHIDMDDEPTYDTVETSVEITENAYLSHTGTITYARIVCQIGEEETEDNKDTLNRTIRLIRFAFEAEKGFRIAYDMGGCDITSLKTLPAFDAWLIALAQNGTYITADIGNCETNDVQPETEPECMMV